MHLGMLSDADLAKIARTPIGDMPLGEFIGVWILNAHSHAGEISALKGLKGLQGYLGGMGSSPGASCPLLVSSAAALKVKVWRFLPAKGRR